MADIKSHSTLPTSLVSYWDLQEASGTRYDLVGSNDLTDVATVTQGTGKIGKCADLEIANSEYLSIADNAALSLVGDISISMWVKLESFAGSERGMNLLSKFTSVGDLRSYRLWLWEQTPFSDSDIVFNVSSDGTATNQGTQLSDASVIAATGTWYHIAVTFDASAGSAIIYLNGAVTASTETTSHPTSVDDNTSPFNLGGRSDGLELYDGLIDEVGIWSKVLTSDEVSDLYNSGSALPYYSPADVKNDTDLTTSLTSYYEMSDDGDTDKVDATAAGNDLTETTSDTIDSATGITNTGGAGLACDFEAADTEYVSSSSTDFNYSGTAMSFATWAKAETLDGAGSNRLMTNWAYPTGYFVNINENTSLKPAFKIAYTTGYQEVIGATALSTATWYHLACVYDGVDLRIYVDGVLDCTPVAFTETMVAHTGDMRIGANESAAQNYDGLVDESGFWSKALTVAEVRALYGYGVPPPYEASTTSIKSINGLAIASVKSVNGLAIASVKSFDGLTNV